jgi:hypothetical protein
VPRLLSSIALVLIAVPNAALAQTITSRSWSDPEPGVRILEGQTSSPTTRFHAAFVDLCADYVHVDATARPTARRTASSWGTSVGATVAVNGDFFKYESPPRVYGLAAGAGTAWPVAQTGEASAASSEWFYRDYGWIAFGDGWVDFNHTRWVKNNVSVSQGFSPDAFSADIPAGTRALVSGFPELVTEGSAVTCSSPTAGSCFPDRSDMRARHPRTAMGLTEDRQTFILLVVDGRSTSSVGMYGTELASLMHQLGAWQAFNLDGGGSSQMWVSGRGTINRPSDGTPRSVANHWGILAGAGGGRSRIPGSCMPPTVDACFQVRPDGSGCEVEEARMGASWVGGDTTSDVDGDGLADVCIRHGSDYRCRLSSGDAFGEVSSTLDAFSDAEGFDQAGKWSTIRMGDFDADGRADVCGRAADGIRCILGAGEGASIRVDGPGLTDEGSWGHARYGSTLRVADIDGDHRDDLCARAAAGIRCWRSTGEGFSEAIVGPEWSNDNGWGHPRYYATIRFGDIDGDGRDDLCARAAAGFFCYPYTGDGFGARVDGPEWSDAGGFDDIRYWSTLRLADVDGDGRKDVCIRTASDLRCHISMGDGFGGAEIVGELSDDSGWWDHSNYSTLRTGDIDGDGADELCIRANRGVLCYRFGMGGFARFDGPALSDESGWNAPRYYTTLRLADVNGDGRDDLCARAAAGPRCWVSTGMGFSADAIGVDGFTQAQVSRYSGFRVAGPHAVPLPEVCNGADDDLDGEADEDGACDRPPPAGDDGGTWPGSDGGVAEGDGGGDGSDPGAVTGGCSAGGRTTGSGWLSLFLAIAFVVRRRRD